MKVQLKVSIEKFFIITAFLFGILLILITPPFQSVDEANHFFRSYAVSQGQFISIKENNNVGSFLPKSLFELNQKFSYLEKDISKQITYENLKETLKINDNETVFINYPNTALYSPAAYIPQTFGILAGKIFKLPPILLFYLARLFNLITYCILGYYAIKSTPFLKLAAALILLCPMNLSLGASCSTDVTLIGVSILLFAKILQYKYSKENLSAKQAVLLGICLFILALTKHNFYFIPLIFLIPKENFSKKYYLPCIILPAILGCLIWTQAVSGLYVPLNPKANMYEQISFIINNPVKYTLILILSTIVKAFRLFITSIGVLGCQDTKLDNITYIIYPILLWLSIVYSGAKQYIIKLNDKILIISTATLAYIIITTYLYLAWSKVGGLIIEGLNGKYYTPLLLPVLR